MKNFILILSVCVLAISFSACSARDPDVDKPAHELAKNGMDEFEKKDYRRAIELFGKLRDWYPFSKYAKLAELKIADAHYFREEYEDAVFAYENFEELHPKNEAIPYVIHQIGLCYFERLATIDRDQTPAKRAIDNFERLIKTYPDDPLAQDAREKIVICKRNIAEHEFYIGRFYYKTKHYKAALYRFKYVALNYADFEVHAKAVEFIAKCETALAKEEQKKSE